MKLKRLQNHMEEEFLEFWLCKISVIPILLMISFFSMKGDASLTFTIGKTVLAAIILLFYSILQVNIY